MKNDPSTVPGPRPPSAPRPAIARERAEPLALEALASAWDVGTWRSVRPLPAGKSDHYRLETSAGEYVLRRSYPAKTLGGVRFEHELVGFLRARGYPAPEVVRARDSRTEVVVDGRVHRLTRWVAGEEFAPGNARQLAAAGRALARFHTLVPAFRLASAPAGPTLHDKLAGAVAGVARARGAAAGAALARGALADRLLASLPALVDRAQATLDTLDRLTPRLGVLTIHGGCRRGSVVFRGDELAAVLDFDSARVELQALDIAIALHDWAKVYTARGLEDHKVLLDLDVVAGFMAAYLQEAALAPEELEAIPALLAARPLGRALRKCRKRLEGEHELTEPDLRKVVRETARVDWLDAHAGELRDALAGRPPARTRTTTARTEP